jgi:hypothetical protein
MRPNSVVKYFKSLSSSSTSRTLPRGRQGWVEGRCGLSIPGIIGYLLACLNGVVFASIRREGPFQWAQEV